jgi:hypothetical protein
MELIGGRRAPHSLEAPSSCVVRHGGRDALRAGDGRSRRRFTDPVERTWHARAGAEQRSPRGAVGHDVPRVGEVLRAPLPLYGVGGRR